MINANELRLGNWVHHNVSAWSYRNDDGVISNENDNFIWEDRDWYALGECTLSLDVIEPIKLTEEWFLKFGFKKEGGEYYNLFLKEFTIEVFGTKLPINDREYRLRSYGNELKLFYVHQLQNLYFILTGLELQTQAGWV